MSETIAGGLVKQIENFLAEHPQTNFIAIDTLQRVRDASGEANAYANDYREVNVLKTLADKHRIAILLIHHLRKQADNDPLNMISGTTGLTGAVDGIYVLKKDKRTSSTAKFIATGRDIEQREFTLEFDSDSHLWNLISDDTEHTSSPSGIILAAVKEYLQKEEIFIGSATELAGQLGTKTTPSVLSKTLMQNQQALAAQGIKCPFSRKNKPSRLCLCAFFIPLFPCLSLFLAPLFSLIFFLLFIVTLNNGVSRIRIIGGEPLLHPFFREMVVEAATYFSDVEVSTNGCLITSDLAELFAEKGVSLSISYYSDIESEYEKVTGMKGSFSRLQRAFEILDKTNVRYRVERVKMKGVQVSEISQQGKTKL